MISKIKSIHPFPARMAPSIIWDTMPSEKRALKVLDPMAGSGSTLAIARMKNHHAIGYDADPLAVLISKVWTSSIDKEDIIKVADQVLTEAKELHKSIKGRDAYPIGANDETKKFIRFWFDLGNRKQLRALSVIISNIKSPKIKSILWCALSRIIITKKNGVSLAMDVSHSRPHKVYKKAPVTPFCKFLSSVMYIAKNAPFTDENNNLNKVKVQLGDARKLSIKSKSIDLIVTSPPYLNAIDYLRGHKLSLVWMGHSICKIRLIRSENIGSEKSRVNGAINKYDIIIKRCKIKGRMKEVLLQYVYDMDKVLKESFRVLKKNGKAVFVVGNSTIAGSFIRNSDFIKELGEQNGFTTLQTRNRRLPANKRYLPPPSLLSSGKDLSKRMRQEVIITFIK